MGLSGLSRETSREVKCICGGLVGLLWLLGRVVLILLWFMLLPRQSKNVDRCSILACMLLALFVVFNMYCRFVVSFYVHSLSYFTKYIVQTP